jgi:hypothetical protein
LPYFRRRDAAGENGRLGQAEGGRLALQGGAFRPVADDQRPHRQAALPEQPGRLEERADPLVRDQAGYHADDLIIRAEAQCGPQFCGVGERLEELPGDGVRHDEDLLGGDAAGHDLLFHGLAERHHQVGGQHAPGLEVAVPPVQFAMGEFGGVRVAGQPRVFPEPAHLVDDGQAVPLPQGQRDPGVGVVTRRVQHGGADLPGELVGQLESSVGGPGVGVGAAGHPPRQQAVVRDAVQHDQAPAVDQALGHRVAAPRHHVRVEPVGALGQRDLVRPDRVPGARGGERVVDQVQHAPGPGGHGGPRGPGGPGGYGGAGSPPVSGGIPGGRPPGASTVPPEEAQLGGEGLAQASCPAAVRGAGRLVKGLDRLGEAAFAPGQASGQHRPGTVVFGEPAQCRGRGRGLVDGQAERGEAPRRGLERRPSRVPVARAPQYRRTPVRTGEPEPPAERARRYSLGENQCADRVGGRVPPGDRRRERKRAGRHVRVAEAVVQAVMEAGASGPRPTRGGRHHGR